MVKYIELTQGKRAIVDDEDYEKVAEFRYWWANKSSNGTRWYAWGKKDGGCPTVGLHWLIANPPAGFVVDHKDHDGLNNVRNNLRWCTHADNTHNSRIRKDNTSGYKGVGLHKFQGKIWWRARIAANGKRKTIGHYRTAVEAALAYDRAARELHGEFAYTNFNNDVEGQMMIPMEGIEAKKK